MIGLIETQKAQQAMSLTRRLSRSIESVSGGDAALTAMGFVVQLGI
jgi:hypothetical protein